MDGQSHCRRRARAIAPRSRGTCARPACRCAAADGRAKGRQMPQFRRRCPPTPGQIPQFLRREVSTDVRPARAPSASACEPYRELIAAALGRGRNAVAIYQDLVDDHGFTAKYASVRRFVVKLRGTTPAEARVVITTAPGEEGQVDYGGDGPMVRDPSTGKYKRARLFVLTLGYSRKCVRLLTWRSSAQIWAELHERAFRRLGGTVKVIVPDNLSEGVLTPDIYDPTLNPLYRDVLAHYGVVALPCRVRRSGSQRQSGGGRRPRAEDATQRAPLRDARGRAGVPRSLGDATGPTRGSTAPPNARSPRCLPRNAPPSGRCRSNRFATTASARARCISMAASKSRPRTTARRPAGSGSACRCSGTICTCGSSRRRPANSCASICAPRGAGIGSTTPTGRRARRPRPSPCSAAPPPPAPTSAPCVSTSTRRAARTASGRSSASSRSLGNTARPSSMMRRRPRSRSASSRYRFLRKYVERRPPVPLTLRQVDPLIRQLTLYRDLIDRTTGDPT